jgi:CRP/FNR family cyclic AMP-dependent transcriptional regulator
MRIVSSSSMMGIPILGLGRANKMMESGRDIFDNHIYDYVHFRNESIYIQEDPAEYLYIVISGYVRISYILEDGNCLLLGIVPPGEGFGELGVYEGENHTETAAAMGDVCVARIRADVFRDRMMQQHEVQSFLAQLLARRYRWYLQSTRNLSLSSLSARLSQVLLFLCKGIGRSTEIDGKSYLYLPSMITQSDLGAMARGTRGNVNRLLKKWEREGWVLLEQRRIVILKRWQLEALINEEED